MGEQQQHRRCRRHTAPHRRGGRRAARAGARLSEGRAAGAAGGTAAGGTVVGVAATAAAATQEEQQHSNRTPRSDADESGLTLVAGFACFCSSTSLLTGGGLAAAGGGLGPWRLLLIRRLSRALLQAFRSGRSSRPATRRPSLSLSRRRCGHAGVAGSSVCLFSRARAGRPAERCGRASAVPAPTAAPAGTQPATLLTQRSDAAAVQLFPASTLPELTTD